MYFMEYIIMYVYGGMFVFFMYENFECFKNGRENCVELDEDNIDWLEKFYRFMRRVEVYRVVVIDFVKGLELDMKDDLEKIIERELLVLIINEIIQLLKGEIFFNLEVFEKVNMFIINKLYDIYDWFFVCFVNLNVNKVLIFGVVYMDVLVFGIGFKFWVLLDVVKF